MKVVNFNNNSHHLNILPRYYPNLDITVTLTNEITQEETIVTAEYMTVNGLMGVSFDYNFIKGYKYQIKITNEDGVLYRDKIIATDQDPQEFKQTNDLYYYE